MQQNSIKYIVGFSAVVCLACSLLVSSTAVLLKDRQLANQLYAKQIKILAVSGLIEEGVKPSQDEVNVLFDTRIESLIIDMQSGKVVTDSGIDDPLTYDQLKASKNPALSNEADANFAKVKRVPKHIPIYIIQDEEGNADNLVLPVEGMGLWGTLYGFVSLDKDIETIRGLTFFKHKETPGLGAEVDNPSWKAKWPGRKVYDDSGEVMIKVIKGPAGTPEETPYAVDGLAGATLTSNGVTNLLRFWLGKEGFGPYLASLNSEGSDA
ncbi:MAG: Na(+)-translocating NADH-quinone reductase subunit C [Candidatus Hydrogenedentota bacterium]